MPITMERIQEVANATIDHMGGPQAYLLQEEVWRLEHKLEWDKDPRSKAKRKMTLSERRRAFKLIKQYKAEIEERRAARQMTDQEAASLMEEKPLLERMRRRRNSP
jgi:hypothetical protein